MTIKDAAIQVMYGETKSQKRIIEEVVKLTGYSYESVRGNLFRSRQKRFDFVISDFVKIKIDNLTHYKQGNNTYMQNFNKPQQYFEFLEQLNSCEKIYTLCGTDENCMKVLDRNKTIKVDHCKLTNADVIGDIFDQNVKNCGVNLDFEGIITKNKVAKINMMGANKIVLTIRSSKNDYLVNYLNYTVVDTHFYRGKKDDMKIYLLEKV